MFVTLYRPQSAETLRAGRGTLMPVSQPPQFERAVVVIDETGVILAVSATDLALRLVEKIEAGQNAFDRLHPEDRDVGMWFAARAARERRPATVELRWLRASERWSKLATTFSAGSDGGVCLTLGYDEAHALRRAEEQMRRVVEGSAQGIVVRTQSEVLYMNDSFARLVGYRSHRECIASQSHVNGMIHPDDLPTVIKHLEARIRGEEVVSNYEFRLLRRDGTSVWAETYASNVNWDGKSASLSWISDISMRKAIEAESKRSREAAEFANRTKTQFLANMSHELRTPLNAILGFSEVIQHQMFGPVAAKYLDYVADIHRSGRLLLDLVNDVLDLSKLEAGKLDLRESELCLATLIEDCVALVRSRADEGGVRLVAALSDNLPRLRADGRAVQQLLLNFLTNAIKFTPAGGEVRVHAANDLRTGLSLSVSDTGVGMTEAEIEVALSPFGQVDSQLARKHEGTGLGLPICRSLMELHGGNLTVSSTPEVGTTLTARFPRERVLRQSARAS